MNPDNTTNPDEEVANHDEVEFTEEIGNLVFQSALMQFLAEEEAETAERFEAFVETHVAEENFIEVLCAEYPKFRDLLQQEIAVLQSEIKEVTEESPATEEVNTQL